MRRAFTVLKFSTAVLSWPVCGPCAHLDCTSSLHESQPVLACAPCWPLLQVFDGNCAACHAGGNNTVISDHTLHKAAMEQFLSGGFNLEAIVYQVG